MYFLKKYRRGIRNKYMKGTPVPELMIKDLKHLARSIRLYFNNGFRVKKMFIYPHFPSSGSTIYKVANELGYSLSNKYNKKAQVAIYWEYLTYRKEFEFLESINQKVINLKSRDIGKFYVDKAFNEIFGYSTIVDPLKYSGKCVKKNDVNAKHDGVIIECPVDLKEEGYIYQLLIDNTISNDLVEDIRVPVVNTVLDFVYLKHRLVTERFKNTTVKTTIGETKKIFDATEITQLNAFCKHIGLDYGELDVLRDKTDGRIYVVDVNNTPQGPPAHTSKEDKIWAIKEIAKQFSNKWLK